MKNFPPKSWFIFLLAIVGIINTITMPYYFYAGDSVVQKTDAFNLLRSHHLGSDPKNLNNDRLIPAFNNTNQYFIHNPHTDRFVSRWGIPNSVIMAIPEIFTFYYPKNSIEFYPGSILAHNIFNILLSMLFACYIFYLSTNFAWAALRHPSSVKRASPKQLAFIAHLLGFIFTLATCYASFVWYYLRAQTYDLWQLLLFTMFITHYLKAMDIRAALPKFQLQQNRKYLRHLCGAVLSLSILVLVKELYGLLFGAILLDQWWRKASGKSYLFWIGLGGLLLIVMAILNYEAYGMIFLGRNRLHHDPFSNEAALGLQYLGPRIKDYLFSLNWSVWFNFPLVILALFGYPASFPYFKKMLRFVLLCLGIVSIFLLLFYSRGEWCYGPRYYLFILPVLSLPAVFVLAKIITLPKKWAISISLLLLAMAGINIYGQCLINDREVFMSYSMSAIWEVHGLQSKYFDERPRMLVMYDLRQMFYHLKNGPLFEQLFAENVSHEEKREILHEMLQKYFAYRRNYWLLPNVKPRAADYR